MGYGLILNLFFFEFLKIFNFLIKIKRKNYLIKCIKYAQS
jgi:hypothetical protein